MTRTEEPMPNHVASTFTTSGHRLAYEVFGTSGVPVLLMHGLLLDSGINRGLARRLVGEGHQVVLLDLLGHGRSDRPTDPKQLRIDFFAQHALALLDHLGIERAIVGGVSLGAITALQVAERAPGRCLGLFLEMPVMEASTTFAALLLVPVIGVVHYGESLVRIGSRLLAALPRPKDDLAASLLDTASSDPATIRAVLHGILVGPVVPSAAARRGFTMPALVVGHRGDFLHAHDDAAALAQELPDAELLLARWMGELRVHPERLWPTVSGFFARVRAQVERGAPAQTSLPA